LIPVQNNEKGIVVRMENWIFILCSW